jgi:hypothetical protein
VFVGFFTMHHPTQESELSANPPQFSRVLVLTAMFKVHYSRRFSRGLESRMALIARVFSGDRTNMFV